MYQQTESILTGYQEVKLFLQSWELDDPKGHLIITHGQGEHSDCYQRLVQGISLAHWNVYAWDLRGHGRSEGIRGYAGHFDDYVMDYEIFMTHILGSLNKSKTKLPIVSLTHSMGGLIHLKALVDHKEWNLSGQILSSPMLGLALPVPTFKQIGAQVLFKLLPKMTMWNEIQYEMLSRDPQVLLEYERDVFRHNRISSGVYLGSMKAIEYVFARVDRIRIPTFMQLPENDPIVSTPKNKELFKKMEYKQKSMKIYKGRQHELYNDVGREEVFDDIVGFLNKWNP